MSQNSDASPANSDISLARAVKKSGRRARRMALLFAAPLLLYLLLNFMAPVGLMMVTAWRNDEPPQFLPKFYQAMQNRPWPVAATAPSDPALPNRQAIMPDEAALASLAEDLAQAQTDRTLGQLAKRLNYEMPGLRSKIAEAARMADAVLHPQNREAGSEDSNDLLAAMAASSDEEPDAAGKNAEKSAPGSPGTPGSPVPSAKPTHAASAPATAPVAPVAPAAPVAPVAPVAPENETWRQRFLALDPIWGEAATWAVFERNQSHYTWFYSLTALDLTRDSSTGRVIRASDEQAIYLRILGRTLWIASLVTVATLLLGFPVAYVMTVVPPVWGRWLMLLVLLPLWTSLLVRTTAWVVLLQSEGVINAFLLSTGLVTERVQMIFTRFGTLVAMTHIQLPFTLLPIYSVMRTISGAQLRAARSLGAPPLVAWWRIYAPQTVPGVVAGGLMTFILSLAYYITPALVGGPNDQMMSNFIATFINRDLNWGLAAALSTLLLVVILILYWVFLRLVGWERIKLG
ncbi:MAG: ABC transporter permease [Candidatus Symbiobacter sp.]|nr:ABC transporter permease [Candidatus Symbiobacter sp.]